MTDTPTRRLAAILCADVAGFSRMVQADEEGTLATLRDRRLEVIDPAVVAGSGRVVKYMGDGFLAEFPSAVNAVKAALDLQARMAMANAGLPAERHLSLRIGINLGDILGEGEDILGEGVNIAARLEPLAEPGGIVVSAKVQGETAGKVAAQFADMGEQVLKNIAQPVRAYRVATGTVTSAAAPADPRLSVAVLPFASLGADPDQQYFGDGVTEDIITELSRNPVLQVVSRNASFRFRGPDADIAAAARALGVRYVVEGSVRRMGPRIRITAQLIDTGTGAHLWAERYDRPADDIFEVQDDVVRSIVGTLTGRLQAAGAEVSRRRPPASLAAYDLVLQAEHSDWSTLAGREAVRALARQALALDPGLARAETLLGTMDLMDWGADITVPEATIEKALDYMRRAITLDPDDFYGHVSMAEVCLCARAHDLAERHLARALALNPNRPSVHISLAHLAVYSGRAEDARDHIATARRVDPFYQPPWLWTGLVVISYCARRYDEAIEAVNRIDTPADWVLAYAAAAHAMLGDKERAAALTAAVLRATPGMTIAATLSRDPFRNPADREHVAEGMRRAGLPE